MKQLRLSLVAAAISLGAALPATAQDMEMGDVNFPQSFEWMKANKCKPNKAKGSPSVYRTNTVPGPAGLTEMEMTLQSQRCANYSNPWLHGLRDKAGKEIVPVRYRNVHAINPTAALVQRLDKSWAIYEGGKERELPFPAASVRAADARGPCTRSIYGTDGSQGIVVNGVSTNGVRKVAYFHGSTDPAVFDKVPDDWGLRRVGGRLYVRHEEAGGRVSRVYTLAGVPVSGTLAQVGFWQPELPYNAENTCKMGHPDVMAMGPSLDQDPNKVEAGHLWFPLNPDGEFAALPNGAIGVIPLASPAANSRYVSLPDSNYDWLSNVWGLVYAEPDGWSYTVHSGSLRDVLANAGAGRRYRGVVFGQEGYFAAIDAQSGKWVVPEVGMGRPWGTPAGDARTAIANFIVARDAHRAETLARLEREKQERYAAQRAEYLKFRAEKVAEGRLCNYRAPVSLTIDEISFHAERCPGTFDEEELRTAKAKGLSDELVMKVRVAWGQIAANEYRAQAEREEMLRNPAPRPYYPGAFESAIRQAGDNMVRDINKRSENWFDQRRQQYRDEWQRKQRAY
jgi:hypothetical protein